MRGAFARSVIRWAYMRRAISILLLVLLWLPCLSALALGSEGVAHLPVCCRRSGAHNCAMADDAVNRIVAASAGKTHFMGASSRCPLYPGARNATLTPTFAIAPRAASLSVPRRAERIHGVSIECAFAVVTGADAVRGPPETVLG
jgi:hypothetical protein